MYSTLKKYWGYDSFRHPQEDIIQNILNNKDCFVVLSTGSGKSICFQIPALLKSGVTVVISPLIALMEDQVKNLTNKNINAVYLNSTLLPSQEKEIYKNIKLGFYKIIYVSPEKLISEKITNLLKQSNLSMIVFDEVHCLSEWGHDFRPNYKRIAEKVKSIFNDIQVVALTATVTESSKKDIINILKLNNPFISLSSFNRKNIFLGVKKFWTIFGKTRFLKNQILKSKKALIYCSSRYETEIMAEKLSHSLKIKTSFYHAGCNSSFRKEIQEKFKNNEITCLFATTAFGMGIDISDIDLVIYWNCASSIEEYYQGIGRAGRDERINANSWIIYTSKDISLQKNIINFEIPEKNIIKGIVTSIKNNESINKIKTKHKVSEITINSINLIYDEIEETNDIKFFIERLKSIKEHKKNKFDYFYKYLKYSKCKRRFLLNYFSEITKDNCDNCSICN
jgi:ATP-dependent DNA helicase RecQ